ncbi:hypothetical protein SDJN03_14810, partial [Cucurbita argyrosperma subsp. sororia]
MIEAEVDVSVVLWMFVDAYLQGLPLSFASSGSIPSLLKLVLVSHLHSITNINSARYLYIHAIKIVSMSLIQEAYLLSRMIYYFTTEFCFFWLNSKLVETGACIPITSQVPHLHWSGRMRIAVDMLLTQIKWTSSKPTAGDGKGATLDDPSVDIGCLDGDLIEKVIYFDLSLLMVG